MKFKGEDLIFISRILRDGKGVEPMDEEHSKVFKDDLFTLSCLSMTAKTFIASGMSSFIVKQKPKIQSSTNSEIGSYHWFHTIIGRCKSMGEYLSNEDSLLNEKTIRDWSEQLYKDSEELIKGFEYINK